MEPKCIEIYGGNALAGKVTLQGDKIVTNHLILATLLITSKTVIKNVPLCKDVVSILAWIEQTGLANIKVVDNGHIIISPKAQEIKNITAISSIRASICLLTPLALINGYCYFNINIGGCNFINRPINKHLELLEKFGGTIEAHSEECVAKRRCCMNMR